MSLVRFSAQNHPQQVGKVGAKDHIDDRATTPEMFGPLNDRFGFTLDVAASIENAKCDRFYTKAEDGLRMPWYRPVWQGDPCLMCEGSGVDRMRIADNPGALTSTTTLYEIPDRPCRNCLGHRREPSDEPEVPEVVWCNPPFSDIRPWVEKAHREHDANGITIVMLLPANRTEQKWWQGLVEPFRDTFRDEGIRVEFLPGRPRFIRAGSTSVGPNERPPFGCCLLIWGAGS